MLCVQTMFYSNSTEPIPCCHFRCCLPHCHRHLQRHCLHVSKLSLFFNCVLHFNLFDVCELNEICMWWYVCVRSISCSIGKHTEWLKLIAFNIFIGCVGWYLCVCTKFSPFIRKKLSKMNCIQNRRETNEKRIHDGEKCVANVKEMATNTKTTKLQFNLQAQIAKQSFFKQDLKWRRSGISLVVHFDWEEKMWKRRREQNTYINFRIQTDVRINGQCQGYSIGKLYFAFFFSIRLSSVQTWHCVK